jgi:hypothetical protein
MYINHSTNGVRDPLDSTGCHPERSEGSPGSVIPNGVRDPLVLSSRTE